jgi:hypothetical protein
MAINQAFFNALLTGETLNRCIPHSSFLIPPSAIGIPHLVSPLPAAFQFIIHNSAFFI